MSNEANESGGNSGEEAQVTYVGGKAIEQHESLDSDLDGDTREAAKEAVRKAIREAGESSAKEAEEADERDQYKVKLPKNKESDGSEDEDGEEEPKRGKDGKFLPRDGSVPKPVKDEKADEEEETVDPETASLKQLMKHRAKLANEKREVKSQLDVERQKVAQQTDQLRQFQAQLQAQHQEMQRERARLQRLRSNPAEAIREIGYDPEQFILDLAQDGTPEGAARKQNQAMQAQLEEMRQWKADMARQQQEQQQQYQIQQVKAHRASVEKEFLDSATNEEKYPHMATFYSGNHGALVAWGDMVAAEYRKISGGKEAGIGEILDYIEEDIASKSKTWYEKQQARKNSARVETGKTPKGSKGRTLTPGSGGERRAIATNLQDLDGDERLAAAREAVGIALASTRSGSGD